MSPAESSNSPAPGPVVSLRHGTYEDAQALFSGTLFVAMALMLFNQAGLLIGSTAGMAFLLHYVTDISFGKLFFVVNLPFYWFAWTRMGREFTLKTFSCVALLSLLTELFPHVMQVSYINPLMFSRYPADLPVVNANQDTLAEVLGGLLKDGHRRHEVGVQSRAYVEKYHDSGVIAKQLVGIYEELVEKRKQRNG